MNAFNEFFNRARWDLRRPVDKTPVFFLRIEGAILRPLCVPILDAFAHRGLPLRKCCLGHRGTQ
jgi:hypothetical protein